MKRIGKWALLYFITSFVIVSCGKDDAPTTDPQLNGTPTISQQVFEVSEDMLPGEIDNVDASDPEEDSLEFSITTNSSNLFAISETGMLSLASDKSLDFETETSHEIVVEVTDGENSASAPITINVGNVRDEPFVTQWEVSAGETLEIPTGGEFTYNCTIDWGDGTVENITTNSPEHTYDVAGTYTVSIGIGFPSIEMRDSYSDNNLVSIDQWGEIEWKKLEYAFSYCTNMIYNADDVPDLSQVTSLEGTFEQAYLFNGNLNNWNVSSITNMSKMFQYATLFNSDLDKWDVSNVIDMSDMFVDADAFNGDISSWNVSKVENMRAMFVSAQTFDQDLNSWTVTKVANMAFMFHRAKEFNGNISSWDVSNVTDMGDMFSYATSFNQNLGVWNVGNVTTMSGMFREATSFSSDLSDWDVQKVTDMSIMFSGASSFNGNISDWKVGAVTDMWGMFRGTDSFDQDLSAWDISNVDNMTQMLNNSGLSVENYDNTLIGWASQEDAPNNIEIGTKQLEYCNGESARNTLIGKGWEFDGDMKSCND